MPPVSHRTRFLTGLIGRDIAGSRSPWLHEREADAQSLRLVYSLYDFAARGWTEADLPALLSAAKRLDVAGLNVTHPYKQAIVPLLDLLAPSAARIGAVNTIEFAAHGLIGHNTDVIGFTESFRRGLPNAPLAQVVQIGAGGAGFATGHALVEMGAGRLEIFDTNTDRRDALVAKLSSLETSHVTAGADLAAALEGADGVVNATPIGMSNHPGSAAPIEALRPEMWVADIVYFPLDTLLLSAARARGCQTLNGSGMVVYQAAAAFDIFTGATADRARMLDSFKDFVAAGRAEAA